MKHTPGPFVAWDDGRTIGIERDGEPFAIAEVVDHGDMTDESQLVADQMLFTASPDMLAALQAMLPVYEALVTTARKDGNKTYVGTKEYMDLNMAFAACGYRAAIAKATGSTAPAPAVTLAECLEVIKALVKCVADMRADEDFDAMQGDAGGICFGDVMSDAMAMADALIAKAEGRA